MTLLHYLGLPPAQRNAFLSGIKRSAPERIFKAAFEYTGISRETLASATRKQTVADARHAVIYALRCYTDLYLREIGELVNRDHSTVLNSIRVAESLIETDKDFEKMYNGIIERI